MQRIEMLDRLISHNLKMADEEKSAAHTPSGKLSASMLGEPLQWQVLKSLGVGTRMVDEYTLRKFARGNDVEDWYMRHIGGAVGERQKFITYREAIGYADAIVDINHTELNYAQSADRSISPFIPLEVKSVSNAKYKNIERQRRPDDGHLLQGAFYALGTQSSHFAITYIASDDYRTLTWAFRASDFKDKIDGIITAYQRQMASGVVPVFTANYPWQAKPEYNKYPEWVSLNQKDINLAMAAYYPNAWGEYATKAVGGAKT